MTGRDDSFAALRRRLRDQLSRGEEATLGEVLGEVGVIAEPPAHVDAAVMARANAGRALAEPSPETDRRVMAAAEAALRARAASMPIPLRLRRDRSRVVPLAIASFASFAAAAALAIAIGSLRGDPKPAPTTSAASGSAEIRGPGAQDDFAKGVLAAAERVQASGGDDAREQVATMLATERLRCEANSRCYGILTLRLAEDALGDNKAEAATYAKEALLVNDLGIRREAERIAAEALGSASDTRP